MGKKTGIAWTDSTWNYFTGCESISAGCLNCYAHTFAKRWEGLAGNYFETGFAPTNRPQKMDFPRTLKTHKKIFTLSMSDVFYKEIPYEVTEKSFAVMRECQWHVFQILTKRPEPMRRLIPKLMPDTLPNVWIGVTIEDNASLWRIPMLLETPAAIRFLSIEPLIEYPKDLDVRGLDWVIVGGESGHNSRPMKLEWVRDIRDICQKNNVPFFFKQLGNVLAKEIGATNKGEDPSEWPEDIRIRNFPYSYNVEYYENIAKIFSKNKIVIPKVKPIEIVSAVDILYTSPPSHVLKV